MWRVRQQKTPPLRIILAPPCAVLGGYLAVCQIPVGFGLDYIVSVPSWHGRMMAGLAFSMLAITAVLVASCWLPFPRGIGRACLGLTVLVVALLAVDFHWVLEAHRNARAVGARMPLLLANDDGCGRDYRKRPNAGPCTHKFGMMGRDGRLLTARGYGMAHVRSCALTQRMEDGSGFVWYRIIAQQSVLSDLRGLSGFSPEVAKMCLSGQMTARFEIL
jgi:hypothetical protein